MSQDKSGLNVPHQESKPFKKNFVRLVTCELRFPVILGFEEKSKLPVELQAGLRREYPLYEKKVSVTLRPGAHEPVEEPRHFFLSKNKKWTIVFRPFSIALETANYPDFEEFRRRLNSMVQAAKSTIDADFYTRVGLRYINVFPGKQEDLPGWINQDLVRPLVSGVFGEVEQIYQEARGRSDGGFFSIRHGFPGNEPPAARGYLLDLDFYKEEVPSDELDQVVVKLHDACYDLFYWCIGEAAKAELSCAR